MAVYPLAFYSSMHLAGVAVGVLAAVTWRRLQVRRVSHKPLRNRVIGFISRRF